MIFAIIEPPYMKLFHLYYNKALYFLKRSGLLAQLMFCHIYEGTLDDG